MQNLKRL